MKHFQKYIPLSCGSDMMGVWQPAQGGLGRDPSSVRESQSG